MLVTETNLTPFKSSSRFDKSRRKSSVTGMKRTSILVLSRSWNHGHDVGVVFHFSDEHDVTRLQMRRTPRLGEEVERLGRVFREDNFVRRHRGR